MTATSPSNPLQKAIYDALTAALTPTKVFDLVPKGSAYPYVTIGEEIAQPWDTMIDVGFEISFRIHSWSNAPGLKALKTINETIVATLHRAALTLTGFTLVTLEWELSETIGDPDDQEVRHSIHSFRALVNAG